MDFQTSVLAAFSKRRTLVNRLFWVIYFIVLVVLVYGTNLSLSDPKQSAFFYDLGKKAGQFGFLLLGLIVLPGILGRFRIEIKATRVITLFRRQLGIAFFFLAFFHYHFVRGLILYKSKLTPFDGLLPFMVMGLTAFIIFFFMFLTSNDFSVRVMGKWWKYLHRLVYVAIWLLVLHTGLQGIGTWTILIGIFAMLEVASWMYYFATKRSVTPPAQPL